MKQIWLFIVLALSACGSEPSFVFSNRFEKIESISDFEFVSELARKETATVADLLRLTRLSLQDQVSGDVSPIDWHKAFVHFGWLSEDLRPKEKLSYAIVGKLLAGRCQLQGNFFLDLFGPSEKYGLRECQKIGFLDNSFPNQHVPGSVLMTATSMADAYVDELSGDEAEDFANHINKLIYFLKTGQAQLIEGFEDDK